ncbi:acetylase [Caballeronia calidae]|uniref:Acetylase n=1 Tax=Caballeronia calidae TaxID=1777139 RepID=A0A158CPK1_9BURK|nr:acyltransferase family protein [Caballeronia calidae]SAK84190.1 acetylase [Caballeronia calidae]
MNFRNDINGLRAFAVLAVVLFHFDVPGFKGGFLGVDVFFVISGYLMTDIIFRRIAKGKFSVIEFYADRARRIIPALAFLCFALTVFGWLVLLPSEFRAFGKAAGSSLGFFSNIVYWREAGYFDVRSHLKWLLHTWSLSVEWQFYLLYPLGILLVRKLFGQRGTVVALVGAALVSFGLCVYLSDPTKWPTAAFFLLPTRAWEMLAGGLVCLFPIRPGRPVRRAMEFAGIAMIMYGAFTFNEDNAWPGILALVPVLGTALVLLAARGRSIFTGNRLAQFIGKISYSVYLWHWPFVVALTYFDKDGSLPWRVGAIAGGFVMGWLSYALIESKTRKPRGGETRAFPRFITLRPILVFATLLAVGGGSIYASQGVPERFDHSVFVADSETYDTNPHRTKCHMMIDPCDVASKQKQSRVVVLGDSHAEAIAEAVVAAVPKGKDGDVLLITIEGCPTIYGIRRGNGDCFDQDRKYIDILSRDETAKTPVIIANHWSQYWSSPGMADFSFVNLDRPGQRPAPFSTERYRDHLLSTVCRIAKIRPVYLVEPIPEFDFNVPLTLAHEKVKDPNAPDLSITLSDYVARNGALLQAMDQAHEQCGIHLLDPRPYLCPDGKCMGSHDGRPLYSDFHHMSEYGNRFLVPMFRRVFDQNLAAGS